MCKKCGACRKTISMDAVTCPYCGKHWMDSPVTRYPDRFPQTTAPDGRKFVWGGVVETHKVGSFILVQYIPNRPDNVTYAEWEAKFLTCPTLYHIYVEVDGKVTDACTSANTIEGCPVGCHRLQEQGCQCGCLCREDSRGEAVKEREPMHIYIDLATLKWAGLFLFVLSILVLLFGNLPDHRGKGWANGLRWVVWPLFIVWMAGIFVRGLVH